MKTVTNEVRIVIVQAGWVFVGEYEYNEKLDTVFLSSASCIRVWGTTAGLGELALKGKTSKTVLDFMGEVQIPSNSVICTLKCKNASLLG